jgi:hypothetical protein
MLETALAVSVLAAVIVVGLLISIGNERQRRAIDELGDHMREWAIKDLQIKREQAAEHITIEDPVAWIDEKARAVMGFEPDVRGPVKVYLNPAALELQASSDRLLVISPVEPKILRKLSRQRGRGKSLLEDPPALLGKNPAKVPAYEASPLNAGVFFDIEADKIWREFAQRPLDADRLWFYLVDAPWSE